MKDTIDYRKYSNSMKNFRGLTFEDIIRKLPSVYRRRLTQLKFLRERPDFHPEPSTFHHIQIVTERLFETNDPVLVVSGVLHDIFKFDCVEVNEKTGFPTSPGHDKYASEAVKNDLKLREFCESMGADPDEVAYICEQHMRVKGIGVMKPKKAEELRSNPLFNKLEIFTLADNMLSDFKVL